MFVELVESRIDVSFDALRLGDVKDLVLARMAALVAELPVE